MGGALGSLDSKYFLQKVKLGQGSFGTVWRGVDKNTSEIVAVKQMDKAALPRRGVKRADIEREVTVMKAMSHANILRLLDFYEDQKNISFVLEYCDGGDFGDKVKERASNLTEPEAAEWMRQMCDAIKHMHNKEFCHRDIKPDNFMITLKSQIKLADFGLAIPCSKGKMLTEKCGTPAFMAPEQHSLPGKSRGYSFPADMWAAGITMFMLMAGGRHPFVNGRGQLEHSRLESGSLDFSDGIFGFAMSRSRFSDSARQLCKRMVEPSQSKRITAEDALKDEWMKKGAEARFPDGPAKGAEAVKEKTELPGSAQPPVARVKSSPDRPVLQDGSAQPAGSRRSRSGLPSDDPIKNNSNWLGMNWIFGLAEDENSGPNVQQDDEAAQERRIQLLTTQKQKLSHDLAKAPHDHELHKENALLRQQLEAVQQALDRMTSDKAAKDKQRASRRNHEAGGGGYPRNSAHHVTERDFNGPPPVQDVAIGPGDGRTMRGIERRSTKQDMGALQLGVAAGLLGGAFQLGGAPAAASGSRLQNNIKCRYSSTSYPGWLNAVVECFNDEDSTYSLDVRQHANPQSISPQPNVSADEAWPPGTWVNYQSLKAGWIPAVIVKFNDSGEFRGTYNLDCREYAIVDRIRPRLTHASTSGNSTNV